MLCAMILSNRLSCMQLDLAVGLGWVSKSGREDVMRKHLADEHTNATAQLQTPSGDDIPLPDGGRTGGEHDRRPAAKGGSSKGSTGSIHGKGGGKPRSNSGDRSSGGGGRTGAQPFDYSRMPQGSAGMGAMPQSAAGNSGGGSKYNPFVQGGAGAHGTQGQGPKRSNSKDRGNSKERTNKKQGNSHGRGGGSGVERRDRERSHVFSTHK